MALAEITALPFEAKCPACGRLWTQTAAWPKGGVLTCACGAYAEMIAAEEDTSPPPMPLADKDPGSE